MANSGNESIDRNLNCVIKKAISLRVGNPSVEFKSGCSVIDVVFPGMKSVEIGCITFVNNYTASISIKYKTADESWQTCLKNFVLMPSPHYEEGSQNTFSIRTEQMMCPINDAVLVRIVLRQPSPHWLNFSVHNLCFLPPAKINSHLSDILSSNAESEHIDEVEEENKRVVDIASKLQQMWALAETTAENKSTEEPTHFEYSSDVMLISGKSYDPQGTCADIFNLTSAYSMSRPCDVTFLRCLWKLIVEVDGCYDLNLLSYT